MKKYYAYYYQRFANTFDLISVENSEEEKELKNWYDEYGNENTNLERITIHEMQQLINNEKSQRKSNPEFSRFASVNPMPWKEYKCNF